jgi:2-octaprenyl-6-methoxyphenol hydroxylase
MNVSGEEKISRTHDVAIVGGGLVGASLACALAPLGLRVVLLEAVAFRAASQPSYDDRTLALSASSCRILESLNIWPLVAGSATPIREIHVRELDRPGRVVMDPRELGLDRFGHVVEARAFGAAMAAALPALENVRSLCPASVTALQVAEREVIIEYRDGHGNGQRNGQGNGQGNAQVRARLVVGADGARSFVREALGVSAESYDYGQTAIICNITPEKKHRGRAFECFTPTGPFAVLPHIGDRCGLVWCAASAEARALLDLRDADFIDRAQLRFGGHLGRFLKIGRRSSYPLRLVRAAEDTRPRAVILGNAAHAIHPIGAQGFNLGLRDAAVLAEVLADAIRKDPAADIGRPATLRRYSEWRAPDQQGTIAYSDGLAKLFANPTGMAAAFRTAGLLAHAFLPPLRRQLAARAMGYRGRTPRLARGEPL